MADTVERVKPLRITLKDKDETYTLDFSKESVQFAQRNQFRVEDVTDYLTAKVPEFFYYAFRMHHRKLAKNQTDAILEKIGGLTPKMFERLILLYNQAEMSNNVVQDEDDLEKNAEVVVEMD